ncbi:MAG TPA: thioesterase family protein [Micromonosporaceae bacterium]
MESFYRALDDGSFESTVATRGPWDDKAQHAGPPAALLGHVIERRDGARPDMRVARIAFTIARPVPIAPLLVTSEVVRSGRGTEVVAASLAAADGGPVLMRAEAVLIRAAAGSAPQITPEMPFPAPEQVPTTLTPFRWDVGYHTSMETRYAIGGFNEPGPATVWFRMRCALVAGRPIDPLSRVLTAADSGNGVSQVLDFRTHLFVNADFTVHLYRYPVSEWVCLDAVSYIDSDGIGLADTALYDTSGGIGRGSQSLFVQPRG